jgi:hypothetical protein
MMNGKSGSNWVLGVFILLGLASLGYLLGDAAIRYKEYERTVTVKGLSEKEFPADIVIWPIQFTEASNDLTALYDGLQKTTGKITEYLKSSGIDAAEITVSTPLITDRSAQNWGDNAGVQFRYVANQTVTVYSTEVAKVQAAMGGLVELGKQGIVLSGDPYQNAVQYLFTRLNEVKPAMIEVVRQARSGGEVCRRLKQQTGKIRQATQGQFTIEPRDTNNPHIKNVRVVSTVEYYRLTKPSRSLEPVTSRRLLPGLLHFAVNTRAPVIRLSSKGSLIQIKPTPAWVMLRLQ